MTHARVRLTLFAGAALALVALGGLRFSHATAQGPSVGVDSLNAAVGALSKVELRANDIASPGLGAWTVDVHYDPSLVTILACAAAQGGICNAHYNDTTVRVTGTNVYGLSGNVDLASIGLACAAAGGGTLAPSIDVLADATVGGPRSIDAAVESGSVTCTSEGQPTATTTQGPAPTPTPVTGGKLPGDANCDHVVDPIDAEIILQYAAGLLNATPCPDNADANHDGVINSIDAEIALQKAAGLI